MNPFVLFASSNETDRRALIIGIVIAALSGYFIAM